MWCFYYSITNPSFVFRLDWACATSVLKWQFDWSISIHFRRYRYILFNCSVLFQTKKRANQNKIVANFNSVAVFAFPVSCRRERIKLKTNETNKNRLLYRFWLSPKASFNWPIHFLFDCHFSLNELLDHLFSPSSRIKQ